MKRDIAVKAHELMNRRKFMVEQLNTLEGVTVISMIGPNGQILLNKGGPGFEAAVNGLRKRMEFELQRIDDEIYHL
jgi:hypothetical protein